VGKALGMMLGMEADLMLTTTGLYVHDSLITHWGVVIWQQ